MTKNELLKALQEALKTEETAMPLYTKHIDGTLTLSGFDLAEQEHIGQILHTLNVESTHHGMAFQHLINKVQNEDKDVY